MYLYIGYIDTYKPFILTLGLPILSKRGATNLANFEISFSMVNLE